MHAHSGCSIWDLCFWTPGANLMNAAKSCHMSPKIIENLRKVPLLEGLDLAELGKVFGICYLHQYTAGESVFTTGEPSESLFFLLRGNLSVRTSSDIEIGRINAVSAVGEIGVLSGQARSANVAAIENVMGFLIYGDDLHSLLVAEKFLCRKVLSNVVKTLSHRISKANASIEVIRTTAKGPAGA